MLPELNWLGPKSANPLLNRRDMIWMGIEGILLRQGPIRDAMQTASRLVLRKKQLRDETRDGGCEGEGVSRFPEQSQSGLSVAAFCNQHGLRAPAVR